ncbi:MAG: hypothetical protein ACE5DL_04855 [Nitrosopumilaceae archaeon]
MKPIFILAIAAIAATGIGAAQLNNDINVTAGGFGTGGTDIETPIENATVTFNITAQIGESNIKNLIEDCFFHSEEELAQGSVVFCKLSDDVQGDSDTPNIVAEGHLDLPDGYCPSDLETIPIHTFATGEGIDNLVFNIHDVHLVVVEGQNGEPDCAPQVINP